MGHSILIMLASNPRLSVYGIDIDRKFALFVFWYFFDLPRIILIPAIKVLIKKFLISLFGKNTCNYFGKFILLNFSNNYLIKFSKNLKTSNYFNSFF